MKKLVIGSVVSILSATSLVGCARDISPNVYSSSHVGEVSETYQGTVLSVRQIQVKEKERLQENDTGIAMGAIAGGVGGSMVGKGNGSLAAATAGALLGGVAGAYAQQELGKQQGMEYVVQLTDKRLMTIVQGLDNPMQPGQKVLVMVSNDGRSRIVADMTGAQTPAPPQKIGKETKVVKVR